MNRVIVRVSGVLMFWKYTRANAQVVLEIDAQKSRTILLSNRDSLSYEFMNELDSFLSELAVDTNKIFKDKRHTLIKAHATQSVSEISSKFIA